MTKDEIIARLNKMLKPGGIEESYAREEITSLIDDIEFSKLPKCGNCKRYVTRMDLHINAGCNKK